MVLDVKKDFPLLRAKPGLAYLDSAATAQVPETVLRAVQEFETGFRANVHRGVYPEAERATEAYEAARRTIAQFVGAFPEEIVFTSGTTASCNMLAAMFAERLYPGDEIVVTVMEHHSALLPWVHVAEQRGATVRTVPLTEDYRLDMAAYRAMLSPKVKAVVVTAASNVLGTVNPIAEMTEAAHAVGAKVFVDAAQYAPHVPLDVRAWRADAVAISGHKMYGPFGVGALYLAKQFAQSLAPAWWGGGMVDAATPWRFEAGTPNIAGAIGLAAACQYVRQRGLEAIGENEADLTRTLIVGLLSLGDVKIYGPMTMENRIGVVSFGFTDLHPHDVATLLGRNGVAIRAGHHCAMPLVTGLDPRGVCRASLGLYSTEDDVAKLIQGLKSVRQTLRYV